MLLNKNKLVGLLCLLPFLVTAQIELEPSVVTATKFSQKQSQVTRAVDVLSDSLIQANRNTTLSQLLSQRAGIQVIGQGQTLGSIQTVFTRGAGAAYTLILLDGIPVNDPSNIDSNFDLNMIDLAMVERIEILKSGQSTLYGSNAVAGVINIITKKPLGNGNSTSASLSYGNFHTRDVHVGVSGASSIFNYQVSYGNVFSDGFSSAEDTLTDKAERDGFHRQAASGSLGFKLGAFELSLLGRYRIYDADLDAGAFTDDADFGATSRTFQWGSSLSWTKEKYALRVNFLRDNIYREYLNDSTDVPANAFNNYSFATYGSKNDVLDLFNTYKIGNNLQWLGGIEYRRQDLSQTYESVSAFGPFEDIPILADVSFMTNTSLYSSLHWVKEAYALEAGFRINRHSVYKWNTSYSLSGFMKIAEQQRVFANVGNSFTNPGLYQLFSPFGNEDLLPEESVNLELGWEFLNPQGNRIANLTFFNRTIRNGLFFASMDVPPFGQYINQDVQRAYGFETSAEHQIGKLSMVGNYTFLHGYEYEKGQREKADKSFNILRNPKHRIFVQGSYHFNSTFNVSVQAEYQSKRYDRFYNSETFSTDDVDLSSFLLVNCQVAYQLLPNLRLIGSLRNAGNTRYTEIYGFKSEPLNWKLGLFYN